MVEKDGEGFAACFLLPCVHVYAVYRYASINFCYVFTALSSSELHNFNWQGKGTGKGCLHQKSYPNWPAPSPRKEKEGKLIVVQNKNHILQKNIYHKLEWSRS